MSASLADESSIRNLLHEAEQALANGKPHEAQRLLERAEALAPRNPSVLNAGAVQALHRGDFTSARDLAERAVAADAGNPTFWINLATSLRKLNLRSEELAALERALAIEPRHLVALLQKASLYDLMDERRMAAKTYHNALQTIPPGAKLPESLRAPIARALKVVDENNAQLEAFLNERLADVASTDDRSRFQHGLDALFGKRRIYNPQPTFLHIPRLPAEEFYAHSAFSWLDKFESTTAEIRAEFERVYAEDVGGLEPYVNHRDSAPLDQWKELNHSPRWSVYYLWRDGRPLTQRLARCPVTASLLADTPKIDIPSVGPTAFFSILDAHSHIPPHTGVTNTRLIVHVPLVIPAGCRFRVGSQTREWRPGCAWVFDDTIEHEAWNDSAAPRAILIFDVWNPYLTQTERELVRRAVAGIREYYGGASPLAENS